MVLGRACIPSVIPLRALGHPLIHRQQKCANLVFFIKWLFNTYTICTFLGQSELQMLVRATDIIQLGEHGLDLFSYQRARHTMLLLRATLLVEHFYQRFWVQSPLMLDPSYIFSTTILSRNHNHSLLHHNMAMCITPSHHIHSRSNHDCSTMINNHVSSYRSSNQDSSTRVSCHIGTYYTWTPPHESHLFVILSVIDML